MTTAVSHVDERGFFQELHREPESSFKQVSWFSINPGHQRGHHYHLDTYECFVCVKGEADALVSRSKNSCDIIRMKEGSVLRVKPDEPHAFYSKHGATFISLTSKHFDPENPDTYSSQVTKDTFEIFLRAI